jgi:hypothetical protein
MIGIIKLIVIVIFTVNVVASTTNGAAPHVFRRQRQIINIVVLLCAWITYVPTGWKGIWNLL